MAGRALKLVSLNIERDWHYETVLPFLRSERPLVVCLQEVLDGDVERFERELGMRGVYAPISIANKGRGTELLARKGVRTGHAIFSSLPILGSGSAHYCGCVLGAEVIPESRHYHRNLLWVRVAAGTTVYRIATTHFTWTLHGEVTDEQRTDLQRLLKELAGFEDVVLAGDFNAPRGREIWDTLATKYRDNIPHNYQSSLDQNLHDTPGLQYVVDGLFTTPEYACENTKLVCGVSDHCAVVSTVSRINA